MIFLIDHNNIEGQSKRLWETIRDEGWLELVDIRFTTFEEVQLAIDSSDLVVWRFAQENKMLVLTANRKMKGENSLEKTIRNENRVDSLPVITIGNVNKINERAYPGTMCCASHRYCNRV
ncbi:MAG: ACP S-malonyltransferase [Hydrococcus sp. Prado102]|jgi:hypothetical protein|nr:ACP S-malonyltransferase [Hydrococcus sp. Prado102]